MIGPTLRDGAIVYDTLRKLEDLPVGWTDEQEAGHYPLKKRDDRALFGYVVGPQSWKKFLHSPEVRLFEAQRDGGNFRILNNASPPRRYVFLGVRACELAAIQVQDGPGKDRRPVHGSDLPRPAAADISSCRELHTIGSHLLLLINENWTAGDNSFDLALTEIIAKDHHQFVGEVGSLTGATFCGS